MASDEWHDGIPVRRIAVVLLRALDGLFTGRYWAALRAFVMPH